MDGGGHYLHVHWVLVQWNKDFWNHLWTHFSINFVAEGVATGFFFHFVTYKKVSHAPRQDSPRLPAAERLKGHPVSPFAAWKNGSRGDGVWTSGASNITQRARDLKCSRTYHRRINRWGKVCQMSAGGSKKLSFQTRTRRWNLRALLPLQWHEQRHRHWFFFFFPDKMRDRERAISWFPLTARSGLVLRNVWLFGLYVPFNAAVSAQPFRCAAQRICHFNTTDKGSFIHSGILCLPLQLHERKVLMWMFPHCLLRDTRRNTIKLSY